MLSVSQGQISDFRTGGGNKQLLFSAETVEGHQTHQEPEKKDSSLITATHSSTGSMTPPPTSGENNP